MSRADLILASSSPRRIALLDALGARFEARAADVDESGLAGETAEAMVLRLATAKAQAIRATDNQAVLGADTTVELDGEIFGKPRDREHALHMLGRLSGRTHSVLSGVAVSCTGTVTTTLSKTEVRFREIGPDEAARYWQSGEPSGKAGAYAIQGLGGLFVEAIEGSYTGVVGLPVFETAALLRAVGIDLLAPPG